MLFILYFIYLPIYFELLHDITYGPAKSVYISQSLSLSSLSSLHSPLLIVSGSAQTRWPSVTIIAMK